MPNVTPGPAGWVHVPGDERDPCRGALGPPIHVTSNPFATWEMRMVIL